MTFINWAGSDRFVYLPLFIVPIVLIIWYAFRQRNALKQLAGAHRRLLLHNLAGWRTLTKAWLLCAGLVAIFIALLQPQWGKQEQNIIQEGRDLLVLLDISGSMRAKDLKPSRLDLAKLKIRALLGKLTCERVGLIIFSGSAILQCPMTSDYPAFLMFLDNVDTESIASGTTALDTALEKAMATFKHIGSAKHKLVFLLTDGEDFSTNLTGIQQAAAREHITLMTLGIGSPEGAPIPKLDHHGNQVGHETDETGAIALSKLNEEKLRTITKDLHGKYLRANYDDGDIASMVKYVQSFEKTRYEDKRLSLFHDQYPWFLGAAWLLLALEWLL